MRKMGYATFMLLERTGILTLGCAWRMGWFLGTRCSSPPVMVAFANGKPLVATAKSADGTIQSTTEIVVSLLTEMLWSRL